MSDPEYQHLFHDIGHDWTEEVVSEVKTQVSDASGPYIVYSVIRTSVARTINKGYNQNAVCECGHPYHRHFDGYEDNRPVGCKYCDCYIFKLKE